MAQVSFKIRRSRRVATREATFAPWPKKQRILIFSLLAQTMNELEHWTSENHMYVPKYSSDGFTDFRFPSYGNPSFRGSLVSIPFSDKLLKEQLNSCT